MTAELAAVPWLIVPSNPCLGSEHRAVSYDELAAVSALVGPALRARGARRGDRIVVIADNSVESCMLLVATMQAGLCAVPVAPKALGMRGNRWLQRLTRICADCSPRFVLGRTPSLPDGNVLPDQELCTFDQLAKPGQLGASELSDAPPSGHELALIQYTSGTTGQPRGVELTHANVLHNVLAIGAAIKVNRRDVVLSWLPLFHDMGLIGSLLFATHFRLPMVLMTPTAFLMRPESWLWAISRFGVTCCAAPNSAYQTCAGKIPAAKLAGLDLSSWRAALNGSELVHADTIEAFCRRFAGHGFRQEAMYPVYGLAENTVATAFPSYGHPAKVDWVDRDVLACGGAARTVAPSAALARGVVSVGAPLPGQAIRIVDTEGRDVRERVVGVIQVSGPCVMRGYHRSAERTAATLLADGWLHTGDLGYLHAGELYVVGRAKETIIRGGCKYDAMDIQAVAADVPGVRAGAVAVFGVSDSAAGSERLIVMAESALRCNSGRAELQLSLARRVQSALAIAPDEIVLVPPGAVPRTTSGKVQHGRARDLYVELHASDRSHHDHV